MKRVFILSETIGSASKAEAPLLPPVPRSGYAPAVP